MRPLAKLAGKKALTLDLLEDHHGWTLDDGFLTPPWSTTSTNPNEELIEQNFESYVAAAYKGNGVVFACLAARLMAFSEARFQFQQLNKGRPGDLFGNPSLAILESPWPNGTTGELLGRMEQDVSLAGNFYATTVGTGTSRRIRRLRPDWVTIVSGVPGDTDASPYELDAEVLGYLYAPRTVGGAPDPEPVLLSPGAVVHYSLVPDPAAQWRGMSWITPVIYETAADTATTKHKLRFFENGAQPSYVVKYDANIAPETFRKFVAMFAEQHVGTDNAYKVLHLGGGADPVAVGTDLRQLDFKATQGAGETRIAAASGVGAIIARLSEGLAGSSLNAGNYQAAMRQFADMTIRPAWRTAAAALSKFVDVPTGSRLWYDARDVAFLQDAGKDAADVAWLEAQTIARLVEAGYEPASVVRAIANSDYTLLAHTGKFSVQLQAAGAAAGGNPP